MVFKVTNGPGKFDLMTAVFDDNSATFTYLDHDKKKRHITLSVVSMVRHDHDEGEKKTRWVLYGNDVRKYEDEYFVIYDAGKRAGIVVPFLQDQHVVNMTEKQLRQCQVMQEMLGDADRFPNQPQSAANISAMRFSMLTMLAWMNAVRVDSGLYMLFEWD